MNEKRIEKAYEIAKEMYAEYGVDTDAIFNKMDEIQISLHCWQGDDVTGFEVKEESTFGGGIMATGNYPGKARNAQELRQDIDKAMSLMPGKQRLNVHACYLESNGQFVERDVIGKEHFSNWVAWAKENGIGMDFNPTFFAHKYANDGFTLSHKNETIRKFWIEHGKRSREIAAYIGEELKTPCVNNVWIPDGSKDNPVDRYGHRSLLKDSLDQIFKKDYDKKYLLDAVESKVFGLGSEAYVVGSHEFYMGYGIQNNKMVCLDAGHFHPTEGIADKISSLLQYMDDVLLHVSRPMRWDSDHVVLLNDDTLAIAHEIKRAKAFDKLHIALDFFDASINRITAWVTGTRATQKAILIALLEPTHLILEAEEKSDLGDRLALMEEFKSLPFGAIWDQYCLTRGVPAGSQWLAHVKAYEKDVLSKR